MNYQVLISSYMIRQFDEDNFFFRDVNYHYLKNLRFNPYLHEIQKIVHYRVISDVFKNIFGGDFLPKQKDIIKNYFDTEIEKASAELNDYRSNYSSCRDEVEVLEELLALEKLEILKKIYKDIRILIKISD